LKKTFLLVLTVALTAALLAAPLKAITVQEAAQYYANPGESASVANFTVGAAKYFMIKINGVESVVLKEDAANGGYSAVTEEQELASLAREYLQQQFDAIGFASRAAVIKDAFAVFETEAGRCVEAAKKLIRMSRGTPPYFYITINAGRDFPREYAALNKLNATLPSFEGAVNRTGNSIATIQSAVSSRDADSSAAAFTELHSSATEFKAVYANVSQAHADIVATFPNAFLLQVDLKDHCVLDANETSAVDSVISQSSLGAIKTSPELAKQLAITAASRAPAAGKRMVNAEQARRIASLAAQAANLTDAYVEAASGAGAGAAAPNLTILWRNLGELNALQVAGKNASNASASNYAAAFDKKARETEDKIAFFRATLKDYSASLVAVNNATREVDKVVKKYGTNDERVAALQKDVRSLRLLSESYNDLLRDAMTNATAFQSLTANATLLSARAATLAPKENQLDLVLVGGAVILIGAVIGAFYYLRKKKQAGAPLVIQPQRPPQKPPY
jgi:hypothetical protein